METMRRLLPLLTALSLLGPVLGCHHTAGCCDCDTCNDTCSYGPSSPGSCCGGGSPGLIHGTGIAYQPGAAHLGGSEPTGDVIINGTPNGAAPGK
jgi:hypothetical protein